MNAAGLGELVIPCRVADGPDKVAPIHVFIGNDSTGAAMTKWVCPHCKLPFWRRKPCTHHMGLVMNIPASCRVLLKIDEDRRAAHNPKKSY